MPERGGKRSRAELKKLLYPQGKVKKGGLRGH